MIPGVTASAKQEAGGAGGIDFVANRGSVGDTTSATQTLLDMPNAGSITVGNYLILDIVLDNAGTNGAQPVVTVTDPRGNTWTQFIGLNRDPGAASEGVYLWSAYCKVENAYTDGDDIDIDFDVAVTADVANVDEWTGIHATSPLQQNQTGHTATGTSASPSAGITPTGSGYLIYGAFGVESNAPSWTPDDDTTNGTWENGTERVANSGSTLTSVAYERQAKVATGTAAMTWTPTLQTGQDWIMALVEFAPA